MNFIKTTSLLSTNCLVHSLLFILVFYKLGSECSVCLTNFVDNLACIGVSESTLPKFLKIMSWVHLCVCCCNLFLEISFCASEPFLFTKNSSRNRRTWVDY